MKKTKNKEIEIAESKFYKLDTSKPFAAEGQRSSFPLVLLLVAIFFCAILAFIIITNKDSETYSIEDYKVFFILCGVLLGVAVIIYVAYLIRKIRIRTRIRSCDVTYATITTVIVEEYTTRDNDGDSHTKEKVSLTYEFYDKSGNRRTEHYHKTYGKAPDFYEGQQIVVAFDETKCYVLSKYKLLDIDTYEEAQIPAIDSDNGLTGETVKIKKDKYVPLGYDIRFYISAGIMLAFALVFASLTLYYAFKVKDVVDWAFVITFGIFCVMFLIMAISSFVVPYSVKRRYGKIVDYGAMYTMGKLESTAKVYGNGNKTKYVCKYLDTNEREHVFSVNATLCRKLVRYGDTEILVAYANGKAVALVEKVPLSKMIR